MDCTATIWLSVGVGVALLWVWRLAVLGTVLRRRQLLGETTPGDEPAASPRVSILVAARNEQETIESCLTSLLQQQYPDFEIIAVDDRSTDATPHILERLRRASDGRLTVITIRDLPAGWTGKNHAMHHAAAAATGDWLLFTDADCRQTSPHTIALALREALRRELDLLTLAPRLDAPSVWEKITLAPCAVALFLWFLPYRANDPHSPVAYANGAFLLMRRACYDAIGGHQAVCHALNEDIQLARRAKRAGFRLGVMDQLGLYRTRMYRTPADAWHGWSRIYFGCLESPARLLRTAASTVLLVLGPWVGLALAAAAWLRSAAGSADAWGWVMGAWALNVVMLQVAAWRLHGMMGLPRRWSALYAIGAALSCAMLLRAWLHALGRLDTTWRGTRYRFGGGSPEGGAGDQVTHE